MNKWMLIPTFALATCGIVAALPYAAGQSGGAGRIGRSALKIAVIDMSRLLEQYKKADDLRDEVKAASEASNAKLKEIFSEGQELTKAQQDGKIDPESREFRDREKKIFQLESYVKSFKASQKRELQFQGAQASLEVYNDIQRALKLFSDRNGITTILKVDRAASGSTDLQLMGRTLSQDVIYHQNWLDITSSVVAYLNKQYESTAGAQPGAENKPTRPAPQTASPNPAKKPAAP
ncbi:MAG: OmpH family outer membrane protein [Planctomycetia bacterium]|nr:OmpH family outer membrane protein [Planctomycetia bacterium]